MGEIVDFDRVRIWDVIYKVIVVMLFVLSMEDEMVKFVDDVMMCIVDEV